MQFYTIFAKILPTFLQRFPEDQEALFDSDVFDQNGAFIIKDWDLYELIETGNVLYIGGILTQQ